MIAASVLAWFRRPFRWHLALFGALLPLGVIGQAILGALVVKSHLAPGLVMGHFMLSMLLLDAGFALAWCARYEPGAAGDPPTGWGYGPSGGLSRWPAHDPCRHDRHRLGPPRRGPRGPAGRRFTFEGGGTLEWVVQRHAVFAAVFGIAAVDVWFLLRRLEATGGLCGPSPVIGLLALQGALGGVQSASNSRRAWSGCT